jgi:hypothetical protein
MMPVSPEPSWRTACGFNRAESSVTSFSREVASPSATLPWPLRQGLPPVNGFREEIRLITPPTPYV